MAEENILALIERIRPTLKRGSLNVAQAVLHDPAAIAQASLADLSARAGVSEPTVLRFCNTVGCDGFTQLKLRLVQSLALGAPLAHSELREKDSPQTVATKIFDHTITSLDWTRKKLDQDAIAKAVALLLKARRIEFFGFGASGIVALDAQQKFPLFGVPCIAHQDSHQQLIAASMLNPEDAVVAISNTGSTRSLIEVVRTVKERGASVVVITGSRSPITRYADISIIAETLENTNIYTPTISRLAALVVMDILAISVAIQRGAGHLRDVQDMKRHLAEVRMTGVI
ncbi:MurR/RpiR family transcriptional regulator [Verminephrobacter eiseniae]|uniref:Transcriptional regulator, RpiR family n=1 Tax=Verminephrobacter eiseniae (strain EF01-2) TaxID=391735 RepID=A1WJM6_VEREI|nr:MurR/RpiR family transcriptional regulator [Verminephrobacter eiseniae]ABM57833.1 transcriptional regulator, RpiR family [Verminephrobacter eiseniae EF01-2]MCW5263503.1 MurR/RpiR family transcriptional regulator [Verminephrobacter eiseniae]MCW5283441.1 MurR/RpiR family transcriptional regulator [Verminephrobacter eiseniae]MCW5301150.1 MurR/RpiR family transcriptional regulator [Verminephrobacter eiseniae]MCW8178628.1 MurR/RpiR family transcriptional regulator [Verminephrobacter eiseniae]